MSPAKMDGPWRDANIIPRYNAAGVRKFAFHMPEGMPMIGQPPENEVPGRFPTGYFGKRQEALAWLVGSSGIFSSLAREAVRRGGGPSTPPVSNNVKRAPARTHRSVGKP